MADKNDKYRNPEAPPGYKPPNYPEGLEVDIMSPDALPGFYKFETETNNTKVYIPFIDFVFDLKYLLEDEILSKDDSDFYINTPDEESDASEEPTSNSEFNLATVKVEVEDKAYSEITIQSSCSEASSRKKTKRTRWRSSKKDINSESDDDESDSDYISSKHMYKKKRKRSRSRSCTRSPQVKEEDTKISIKKEEIEQPQHLFGSYHCEVCNIKMSSLTTYESHMIGKKHLKAVKAKNVSDTVLKTIPLTDPESRYPIPPPGIRRVLSREKAKIQEVVEKNLQLPCPALYKVIEIQGFAETSYYCTLCDSPCSCNCIISHLNGYRHRLKCLKYLCPAIYEKCNYEHKYKFESELNKILRNIQRKEGMGKMTVEKEISVDKDTYPVGRRDSYQEPSTSRDCSTSFPGFDESEFRDMSKSGYYCKLCQAPMNCEVMWNSHLNGKRHLSNMKKHPGSVPSKIKSVKMPHKPSKLLEILRNEYQPIVGLEHIIENQNSVTQLQSFQCLLCSASFTNFDIRDHLVSEKHMRKYLQEIKHPELELLEMVPIPEAHTTNLVADICERVEYECGRRQPEVRVIKNP